MHSYSSNIPDLYCAGHASPSLYACCNIPWGLEHEKNKGCLSTVSHTKGLPERALCGTGTGDWLARVLALSKAEPSPPLGPPAPRRMFPNNPFAHLRQAVLPASLAARALT